MLRLAVVLFNLGGPDRQESVRPFLFNLFNDPAIIGLRQPVRWFLALLIAARRAPLARQIYLHLGGGSPLLENTKEQARALEEKLGEADGTDKEEASSGNAATYETKVFVAMRYWHPFAAETVGEVKAFGPDRIVLLPLYPQFSTTTTGSSLKSWRAAARDQGLDARTTALCCYPCEPGFIEAVFSGLLPLIEEAKAFGRPRVLFSAHGLPKKIIASGDPYQWQIERTAAAVVQRLAMPDLDWVISYQSRVGPLEWIGPSTKAEIRRAGTEGRPLVIAPIAFVSEHSETLVELDIEYRRLAEENGVPAYLRMDTVRTGTPFIAGLAGLVQKAMKSKEALCCAESRRFCGNGLARCALAEQS
jgi:ferrochelatase